MFGFLILNSVRVVVKLFRLYLVLILYCLVLYGVSIWLVLVVVIGVILFWLRFWM